MLLRRRPCSNRSISPNRRAHSSKPAARCCSRRIGQTDERTSHRLIEPVAHTMRVVPITRKNSTWRVYLIAQSYHTAVLLYVQSFINKSKRNGYCSPDLPDVNNLCISMKVDLFNKVIKIPIHVLHPLLPPSVSYTQRYGLRPRVHDRTLPERTSNLVDCNFIIRMLYLNAH